jgi:hypothetical protein
VTTRQLAVAAIAVAALVPPTALESAPTLCLFRRVTGRPCPSCGLTRSWIAIAHGQSRTALAQHPFGPLTFLAAVAIALRGPRVLERAELRDPRLVAALGTLWLGSWLRRLWRPTPAVRATNCSLSGG